MTPADDVVVACPLGVLSHGHVEQTAQVGIREAQSNQKAGILRQRGELCQIRPAERLDELRVVDQGLGDAMVS